MKFLINPERGANMAKMKRDSKGRFVGKKGSSRKRRNLPPRDSKGRFVSRRSYRRNPVGGDIVGMLTEGSIGAVQVLTGKAAARAVPDLVGLPKQGNTGLATQAAVAVGAGFVADMFLSKRAANMILAGGLTAPLETLIVAYSVPFFSEALSPTTANNAVGRYVRAARNPGRTVASGGGGMGRYVPRSRPDPGVGDYAGSGASHHASGLY